MQTPTPSPVFRRIFPSLAALIAIAGCEPAPVVIGVATSEPFVDAATMATADAFSDASRASVDTVLAPESSNLAAPAIEKAEEFVALRGMAAVVAHSNSAASLAASQIYNEHEVVQIAPHSSAELYSTAGPFSFRLVPSDDRQGLFLAAQLAEMLPSGSRVALLYVNDDYGRGLRASFLEGLVGRELDIVLDLPHTERRADADLEHLMAALDDIRPAAIVWLSRASRLIEYLPSIRALLGDVPLIGGDALATIGQLPEPAGGWGNLTYVSFLDLGASEPLRDFAHRYEARFGRPASAPDALTYDAMRLLLDAVDAGATTGPEIRSFLQSLGRSRPPWMGVTGPVRFDDAGDVARDYVLMSVEGDARK